jgi:hypothetical protein
MRRISLSLLLVVLLPSRAYCGFNPVFTGEEPWLWTQLNCAVIVAKVLEVEAVDVKMGRYRLELAPLVTLAGRLDPSANPSMSFNLAAHPDHLVAGPPRVEKPPPTGSMIMCCVVTGAREAQVPSSMRNTQLVTNDIFGYECLFMPDGMPLVVLTDLNDPRIVETLKRIQWARAHPYPNPNVPATRPTTAPSR